MIASTAVMVYVLGGIDSVRARSNEAGPGGFNSILHIDHALDQYSLALQEYRYSIGDQELMNYWSAQYQHEFDIVWGNLKTISVRFNDDTDKVTQLTIFKHDTEQFLQNNERAMAGDQILDSDHVSRILSELQVIQAEVHELGRAYFHSSLTFRDNWVDNLNQLHKLLYIFSAILITTALLLVGLLIRSNKRKNVLVHAADIARHEQSNALAELRSGRLEQRAKDSFIASASHDLSQPLHALGLFLGSLDSHVTDPRGRETLHDAIQCSNNLGYLFKSLLDMSRLDAGVVKVEKKHFYIDELISMLEQEYRAKAKNAGVEIDMHLDGTVINSDPILLSRIIRNLVENALTHSDASRITVRGSSNAKHHMLIVEDNGRGISENEQKRIFSEYYQIKNSPSATSKGLGLGLSIVRRLTDLLDMQLSLESEIAVSTRFTLNIPLGDASKVARIATDHVFEGVTSIDTNLVVAVVDDDENICAAMSAMLGSTGIDAVTGTSTDALIDALIEADKLPHLIVADYRLSKGQTGDQAIVQLKRALNIDVPAILVTGDTSPISVANATSSGFDLLHKPISPEELSKKIKQVLLTPNHAGVIANSSIKPDTTSATNLN